MMSTLVIAWWFPPGFRDRRRHRKGGRVEGTGLAGHDTAAVIASGLCLWLNEASNPSEETQCQSCT